MIGRIPCMLPIKPLGDSREAKVYKKNDRAGAMLSRLDIEAAMAAGTIRFNKSSTPEDVSVNMNLIDVSRQTAGQAKPLGHDGRWHFRPGEYCLGYVEPRLTCSSHFRGEVVTRSSYARLGLSVKSLEDGLDGYHGFDGIIEVGIRADTHIAINPGEQIAQLAFYSANGRGACVDTTPLTLHQQILVYDSKTEVSADDREVTRRAFTPMTLPAEGITLPQDTFFLASTAEVIEIQPDRVGYLPERFGSNGSCSPSLSPSYKNRAPFTLHNAAPLIRPGTRAAITLECRITEDHLLQPGMSLPALDYHYLDTPLVNPGRTRYFGQEGPTMARM